MRRKGARAAKKCPAVSRLGGGSDAGAQRRTSTEAIPDQHHLAAVHRHGAGALVTAVLVCMAYVWHTLPREKGHPMTEQQKEVWPGVLLTALLVMLLLGGLLVLRLTGN
jgi:heme A synthase